jgi:hypothetical protein
MMEQIRVIDGKPFITTKQGKRDVFQPPAQVIANAQQRIAEVGKIIVALRQSDQAVQDRLNTATLAGESTEPIRAELQAIADEIRDAEHDVTEAHSVIDQVHELVDTHTAQAIQQADSERLDATLAFFTNFLKDNQ